MLLNMKITFQTGSCEFQASEVPRIHNLTVAHLLPARATLLRLANLIRCGSGS